MRHKEQLGYPCHTYVCRSNQVVLPLLRALFDHVSIGTGALVFKGLCDKLQYYARFEYRGLTGKPEGKRPLGRPRCRWEDNIKMDL